MQNAMEMQEYMKDIFDWQKSIAAEERREPHAKTQSVPAPRGRAASGTIASAPDELQAPAIRPQAVDREKKVPPPAPNATASLKAKEGSAAAHTYSAYSKWDRFDVDAALDEDEAVAPAENKSSRPHLSRTHKPTKPETTAADPKAILTKDSSVGPSPGADMTACSTTRSSLPPKEDNRPLPPIRSQEPQTSEAWKTRGNDLFKIGQWESAAECYTRSFDLFDLTSIPIPSAAAAAVVLSNRAMANLKLAKWVEAEADCTRALELDSSNAKAFHRRAAARKSQNKIVAAAGDFESASRLEPPPVYHVFSHSTQLGPSIAPSSSLAERNSCLSDLIEAEGLKEEALKGRGGSRVSPQVEVKVTLGASPAGPMALEVKSEGSEGETLGALVDTKSKEALLPLGSANPTTAAAAAAASRSVMMRPPMTSTDFESSWRSFADNTSLQFSYINLLIPDQLPSVFKSTLTPQVLASLLKSLLSGVVCGSIETEHATKVVASLVNIPRFEMTSMSLGSKERAIINELWEEAMAKEGGSFLADATLRKKFRI